MYYILVLHNHCDDEQIYARGATDTELFYIIGEQ